MKKKIALILSIIMLLMLVAPAAYAEERRVLRVGRYDAENDSAYNYCYEYLQAISQYTGWEYEYVDGTWEECLERLESGELDLLGFVHKTDEREEIYGYPSLPMATTSGYLVTSNGSSIDEGLLTSGEKISIGIVKGNAYNTDFLLYAQDNGVNAEYSEYETINGISSSLRSGEIDAAVIAIEDRTEDEHILVTLPSYNQYFVTDKDNQTLLRELDEAMLQVNTYLPYLNSDLAQKCFNLSNDGKPVFTAKEREFIENTPNILVLYDAGWPPIEYYDEESKTYKGISPDIFALLTEKCGINFVYEGSTSGEVLSALKNGDSENVITTISYDYAWAEQHGVFISQPFITSSIVKLGRNLDSKDAVIAINEKAFFTYILADELEGMNTLNFSKQAERLEAVRNGEADYTYVTEDQANYYRSIPKYSNLEVEKMVGYEQKICVSIEKDSNPLLLSVISKSLASITHDEMTEIVRRNTVNAYELTPSDWFDKYHLQVILAAVAVAALITVFIVVLTIKRRSMVKIESAYKLKNEALKAAQAASDAKGSFMSRMSHEIRTPLNAVIGYNTIARGALSEAKSDEERRQAEMKIMDCLTKSDIASRHLLTIINDVLDMSAIESGKIKVASDRFDFKGLITSLTTVFYSQAKAKGVNLDVVFDTAIEEWLMGDQMRTNQILTNLISNAVKFTPDGGSVRLGISLIEEKEKTVEVRFEVRDTGIGMTEEYLTHLWTPFEQQDSSISRRFGGTGLGLSITKSLVDIMNGTINVDSKPGEGTKFTVTLTYGRTEQPDSSTTYNFGKINALIVDDDISTCDYIRLLFSRCGARCLTVTSGEAAIEAYKSAEERNEPFTMCLVDWHMPRMDGIETIRSIRQISKIELPIIVITAYDFSELAEEAASIGVKMFVSKPLFQSSLFDLLANITGGKPKKQIKRNEKYDFSGTRILLAEDNAMNMEISRRILESTGMTVDEAWNGEEAVEAFLNKPAGTYKAILMDVHMPVMDGHEATKTIRSSTHPEAKSIPIIAMTADAFVENVSEALSSGMNAHLSKPIDLPTLFSTLEKYL